MGFIEWHARVVKKVSPSNISLTLIGKSLFFVVLGTFFIQNLVMYASALLLFGILLMVPLQLNVWRSVAKKHKANYNYLVLDALGKMCLLVLLGMVFAPFIWPFRWGLLIISIIITLPTLKELME